MEVTTQQKADQKHQAIRREDSIKQELMNRQKTADLLTGRV